MNVSTMFSAVSHVFSFLFVRDIPSNITIDLSVDKLGVWESHRSRHKVSRVITHPGFNLITLNNDIALLQLSSPVSFSQHLNPVCLSAAGSEWKAGTSCWVTGWGNIQTNSRNHIMLVILNYWCLLLTSLFF